MTIAFADTVDRQENKDLILWGVSLLLVLVFHVTVAWLLLPREAPVEPNKPPPPAALLDLPPLPLPGAGGGPGAQPPAKPAAIKPTDIKPAEIKPVQPPVQPVKPPPQTVPTPKFAVPAPIEPKAVEPKPLLPKPQPPKPQVPAKPPDAAPSLTGSAPIVRLSAIGAWQAAVIARLQQYQYWPPDIRRGQMVSAVDLHFLINRQGEILSCSIAVSSGIPSVDAAALETARRAQRLPPLPTTIPGSTFAFTMTFRFL